MKNMTWEWNISNLSWITVNKRLRKRNRRDFRSGTQGNLCKGQAHGHSSVEMRCIYV